MRALGPGDPLQVGPYRTVAEIGSGGMGRVFLGRSAEGALVAVKVVQPRLARDEDFRRRFAREVAAARRVSGEFTAEVLDADPDGSPPWMATGYVQGPSLTDAVGEYGPLTEDSLRALAVGLVEALAAIHRAGIVHRDLKPQNVLLAMDGPKVIDFGVAAVSEASALTGTGVLVGSPAFMSPEQVTGAPIGPASDVFAIGGVIAFAARGEAPFGTGATQALMYRIAYERPDLTGIPAGLAAIVERCLAKEPADRPGLAELRAELGSEAAAEKGLRGPGWPPVTVNRTMINPILMSPAIPEPVTAVDTQPQGGSGTSRRRALVGLGAAVGAVALGGAGWVGWAETRKPAKSKKKGTALLWSAQLPHFSASSSTLFPAGPVICAQVGTAIYAFDAATGTPRWRFPQGDDSKAAAAAATLLPHVVGNGVLFLSSITTQPKVSALDLRSGRELWSADQSAYVVLLGDSGLLYTANSEGVTAFDPATGTRTWANDAEIGDGARAGASALSLDGNRLVASGETVLYALDAATGKRQWAFGGIFYAYGEALVAGSRLFVTFHDGKLYACDLDGRRLWSIPVGPAQVTAPAVSLAADDRNVYVADGRSGLSARDAATGNQLWHFPGGGSAPVLSGGLVYYVTNSTLYALDESTGAARWSLPDAQTTPVISQGALYVSGSDQVHRVDPATGTEQATYAPASAYLDSPPPAIGGGRLFALTQDGLLHAFRLDLPK